MQEVDKLKLLKEILLLEDREVAQGISEKLHEISNVIEDREKLSKKLDPIIQEKFETFFKNAPEMLGPTIVSILQSEIKNSKDQVVEALYPIMGKMIKRYIQQEIKLLSEKINNSLNKTFSFKGFKRKVTSWFSGVKESDLIIVESQEAKIEEVFIVEKKSGILLGNYSKTETVDKEMLSGMLTAIKSFVEDAFKKEAQNLESIEYELFTLHIQNFMNYYITVVLSGNVTEAFENKLENKLLNISQELNSNGESFSVDKINTFLQNNFKDWGNGKS